MALEPFSPAVRAWFEASFPEPTAAQAQGWPPIAAGAHTLILAPTGSGKTLAAFLWAIDRLVHEPTPERTRRTRVLYVSPLRALAVDVEKNLRAPLAGIRLAAERLGLPFTEPTVGLRTGDTPAEARRAMLRHPPDVLITTPESLYLLLTSQARDTLQGVHTVIVDEIHALAPTKRGAHLALSLERLEARCERPPQRIGLSATQRPLEEIARFLGGERAPGEPRPVAVVDAGVRKELDVEVCVAVDDMGELGTVSDELPSGPVAAGPARRSIWPSMHPRLLELVLAHRSTIVFVNARRLAERLAARLNELALETGAVAEGAPDLVRAHHGSLAREQRLAIEDQLKTGRLRGLVATSSLELGIDMGAVDLVVQVESPSSVASGLQRIGRAGHRVGEPSRGKVFPKHRGDLLQAAVVVDRMLDGWVEETRVPRNPLDVLAQQVVAATALDEWQVDDLLALVRRAAPFRDLTDDLFTSVLDLLAGRYPSDEFHELRPRVVWDRVAGVVRARDDARRLAVTSGGTIPDRGLFGVFLPDGTRVGELDEEMVYESRAGETFLLGASTWRISEITAERVVVTPAPGEPGKMPFWHGDGPGRPVELGRALGTFVRELRAVPRAEAEGRLSERHGLDARAVDNLLRYLDEQADATGVVPDDRTVVVERFRDEIGDWRVCVLTPFGARVHAPWALAIETRVRDRLGLEVETLWSDDGIVVRLPEAVDELPLDVLLPEPDELDELVVAVLPGTAVFSARFRECAARALLLPRRRPGRRTPLWQQRQRAADLLAVAARYPSFPILLETSREILQEVFDVPALRGLLRDVAARRVRVVQVETPRASPFASSLLFQWVAVYMYEGDAPLAERRAAALALDRELLAELLGAEELRELLDAEALAQLELELQHLTAERAARSADAVHDLLRRLGPLRLDEIEGRAAVAPGGAAGWVEQLLEQHRAITVRMAGEERLAAAEDAARLRDGLGVALPVGLPGAFTEPVERPLDDLLARFARTHGPFRAADAAHRLGAPLERVAASLGALESEGRLLHGEFRPGGAAREWCDAEVLRVLRRRSLAALRREVEPVDPATYARFLPAWHGIGARRRGVDALVDALAQLQGVAVPASSLELDLLPARVDGYRPADLDALCAAGEVVWVGAGSLPGDDGRVRLAFRDQAARLLPPALPRDERPSSPLHDALRHRLAERGASFWPDLLEAAAAAGHARTDGADVLEALWDLVWAGEVTNDTLGPLRSRVGGSGRARRPRPAGARPRPGRLTRLGPPAAAGRWSSVAPLLAPAPSATEALHALALQLLERHGVVTREAVLAEGVSGGFAAVYPVLRALEERGQVRRGYFVAGQGAAQFALPGAVDRLRSARRSAEAEIAAGEGDESAGVGEPDRGVDLPGSPDGVLVLAATDPAQPFGAALPWPASRGRPTRAAGAFVVLVGGEPAVLVERGGRGLLTFPGAGAGAWIDGLVRLVKHGRVRSLELRRIDGEPAATSGWAEPLRAAGFVEGYRGLTFRS
ncbi:MAG: DEAD/DEAH box helicase [Acidimicrobiales bacterium]|nr:DEAD/DEAH box helicase [Acidimicrobiales bacterium]